MERRSLGRPDGAFSADDVRAGRTPPTPDGWCGLMRVATPKPCRCSTALGDERAALLTHVSADGAELIHTVVAAKAGNAVLCLDPFHVVQWAMKALDKVRTRTLATQDGPRDRNLMWAVRKNPGDLTTGQKTTLAELEAVNAELFRAYLLKEQLREVFRRKGAEGHALPQCRAQAIHPTSKVTLTNGGQDARQRGPGGGRLRQLAAARNRHRRPETGRPGRQRVRPGRPGRAHPPSAGGAVPLPADLPAPPGLRRRHLLHRTQRGRRVLCWHSVVEYRLFAVRGEGVALR